MVVVAGCDDQYTEDDERVKKNGCVELVVSSTDQVISSFNVMTRLVETTVLSYSTL